MYLIHETNRIALKSILQSGFLMSYSSLKKINKTPKDTNGYGLYTDNNFVYFTCTENLFDKNSCGRINMYFNSKLLYNKSFYASTVWSPYPDELNEWTVKNDNGRNTKEYKRKYNKNYAKYNTVLRKLYEHSISILKKKYFNVFQQIAVRNKVNIKELVGIEFIRKDDNNDKLIKYITEYYPDIIIKVR